MPGVEFPDVLVDPYRVPCPSCGLIFGAEFVMLWHYTLDHLPQPRAFIDLALTPD